MVESYFRGLEVGCSGLNLVSWLAGPVQQPVPNRTESGSTPAFAWILMIKSLSPFCCFTLNFLCDTCHNFSFSALLKRKH
jgi:hypothetical protein